MSLVEYVRAGTYIRSVPDNLPSQNMVPFHTAYPMIAFLIYCILAGNTAFVCVAFASPLGCHSRILRSPFCEFPLLACISFVDSWMVL